MLAVIITSALWTVLLNLGMDFRGSVRAPSFTANAKADSPNAILVDDGEGAGILLDHGGVPIMEMWAVDGENAGLRIGSGEHGAGGLEFGLLRGTPYITMVTRDNDYLSVLPRGNAWDVCFGKSNSESPTVELSLEVVHQGLILRAADGAVIWESVPDEDKR